MSGSNDALTQMLLLQQRNQGRRPSAQARLAEQMMASLNNPQPIYGAGPAIARVGQGVLAGLMSGMAERDDRAREEADFTRMQNYQTQREERTNARISDILRQAGFDGMMGAQQPSPQAPPMAPQAAPQMAAPTGQQGAAMPPMPPNNAPDVPVPSGPVQPVASPAMRSLRNDVAAQRQAVLDNPNLTPQQVDAELRRIGDGFSAAAPARVASDYAAPAMPVPRGAPAGAPQASPSGRNYDAAALALALTPGGERLAPVISQMAARNAGDLREMNGPRGPGVYRVRPSGPPEYVGGRMPLQEGAETFAAPQEGVVDGRPAMVQYGSRGTVRVVPNVAPRAPVETAPRSPERFQQDKDLATAGRPTTEIRTGQTLGESLGRNTVEQLSTLRERANTGMNTMQAVDRINALLDSGVITGSLADQRLALERGLSTLGLIDGRRVANTEQLASDLANNVLSAAQQMTGVLTDRDITFLREVSGGSISLTPQTIRRVSELGGRAAQRSIAQYNDVVGGLDGIQDLPEVTRRIYRPLEFVPADRTQLQFAPTPPAPPQRQPGLADRPRLRNQQPSQALPPGFFEVPQ